MTDIDTTASDAPIATTAQDTPQAPSTADAPIASPIDAAGPALPGWAPLVDLPMPDRWEPTPQLSLDDPASFDAPAAHPSQFVVPPLMQGEIEDVDGSVANDARGIQNLLWAADMVAHEGNALLEVAVEASYNAPDLDDAQFQQAVRESHGALRELMGAAEFDRCQTALAKLVFELNTKGGGKLADYLDEQAHVLIQPLVLHKLLVHAGRREHRRRRA